MSLTKCDIYSLSVEVSALARFVSHVNLITAAGILYLFKRSLETKEVAATFLDQISKDSKTKTELPGLTS